MNDSTMVPHFATGPWTIAQDASQYCYVEATVMITIYESRFRIINPERPDIDVFKHF
jgi:hypothetical protein